MVVSLVILLTGCRDRTITSYRAPKDAPVAAQPTAPAADTNKLPPGHPPIGAAASAAPGAEMAGATVPTASAASALTWTAPAGWTAKPLGVMRKGSYAIKRDGGEADLSITAFPGATGGLEANLNGWRGQVGLAALPPEEVVAATEKFAANGLPVTVCDYAGGGSRIVGAIVPFGGNSWFFKLSGPDAVVAAEKPAFLEFLKTIKAP
jgi:hypothetical protein